MSDPDDARALAREFARTLEHLREFRGLAYVGSAPTPASEAVEDEDLPDAALAPDPEPEPMPEPAPPIPTPAIPERAAMQRAPEREPPRQEPPARREPPARPRQSPPERPRAATPHATANNRPEPQSSYSPERQQSPAPENRSGLPRPEPARGKPAAPARGSDSARAWPAAKKLAYLRERNVGDCHRCPLARTRRNIVFGVGNPEADVMFVGEAPGADEDRLGEPFVGAAGRRLDQWIERLGMRRADVYIANVLKCRPPGNRDPQPVEIERCSPFLHAQIRAIEPKVLIALGRFAGCLLLQRDLKLWEMRGKVHAYREPKSGVEVPLVVTYHPAYVLRSEQRPPTPPSGQGRTDRGGAIKSEDEKVVADISRAVSLARGRV